MRGDWPRETAVENCRRIAHERDESRANADPQAFRDVIRKLLNQRRG